MRVDGEILGLAYGVRDVTEFLRRAGMDGLEDSDVEVSGMIDWRGGGPDVWTPSALQGAGHECVTPRAHRLSRCPPYETPAKRRGLDAAMGRPRKARLVSGGR